MLPLTLGDEIGVELDDAPEDRGTEGERIELRCSDPSLPTGPDNLAYRAARLFLDRNDLRGKKVRLTLEKHVPHGAGLGGGSSDAATVLLAINELSGLHAEVGELAVLAAELGSDVPFFVYRGAAICRGRGEQVEPLPGATAVPLLLVKPPFPIPTPWAYSRWRDSRELPGIRYEPQEFPWGTLVNDLERPVFEKFLPLATMKMWLLDQPEIAGALLSGSGSTVFGVLRGQTADGERVAARVREHFGDWWTCACQTLG